MVCMTFGVVLVITLPLLEILTSFYLRSNIAADDVGLTAKLVLWPSGMFVPGGGQRDRVESDTKPTFASAA